MNPYASPEAYRESAVLTASPEQLVVLLYDGASRFLRQAEAAMTEGAWQHAHDRLRRAEAIIDELLVTLDMSQGQIAERLQSIYIFWKRLLREARSERDPAKIRVVVRLVGELRDAWAHIATGAR